MYLPGGGPDQNGNAVFVDFFKNRELESSTWKDTLTNIIKEIRSQEMLVVLDGLDAASRFVAQRGKVKDRAEDTMKEIIGHAKDELLKRIGNKGQATLVVTIDCPCDFRILAEKAAAMNFSHKIRMRLLPIPLTDLSPDKREKLEGDKKIDSIQKIFTRLRLDLPLFLRTMFSPSKLGEGYCAKSKKTRIDLLTDEKAVFRHILHEEIDDLNSFIKAIKDKPEPENIERFKDIEFTRETLQFLKEKDESDPFFSSRLWEWHYKLCELDEPDQRCKHIGKPILSNIISTLVFCEKYTDPHGKTPNYKYMNLRGVYFKKADLSNIRFFGVDLRWAILREAKLREGTLFSGCDLREADISGAELGNTTLFYGCNLRKADLRGAKLGNGTHFYGCDLQDMVHDQELELSNYCDPPYI